MQPCRVGEHVQVKAAAALANPNRALHCEEGGRAAEEEVLRVPEARGELQGVEVHALGAAEGVEGLRQGEEAEVGGHPEDSEGPALEDPGVRGEVEELDEDN